MKKYFVEVEFPDLPGGRMYHSARVEASSMGTAVNRALDEVRSKKTMRGRKIGYRAKISVVEMAPDPKDKQKGIAE